MATKKRIWQPGASYHITNRGNRKEDIFLEEFDYFVYLSLIKNTLLFYEEYNYKLVSYCLMKNHVHLLIKTQKQDPSSFMRRLNSMYARYFNNKYECVGHLFQGRYYSNIITSVSELLEVSRYIHLNPVRAKITDLPEKYRWSSYTNILEKGSNIDNIKYYKRRKRERLEVATEEILDLLDIYSLVEDNCIKNIKSRVQKEIKDSKDKYREYVESKIIE